MKPMTREEIQTVYEAGLEAVIQLVNTLTATIEALKTMRLFFRNHPG